MTTGLLPTALTSSITMFLPLEGRLPYAVNTTEKVTPVLTFLRIPELLRTTVAFKQTWWGFVWRMILLPYEVARMINEALTFFIIRGTGCSCVIVAEEALPVADIYNCKTALAAIYLGPTI